MKMGEVRQHLWRIRERLAFRCQSDIVVELDLIIPELKRSSPAHRARETHRRVTQRVRDSVVATAKSHPEMNFADIGALYNIDGGRVSEILSGFRT